MSWTEAKSRSRIRAFLQDTPEVKGDLPDYTGGNLLDSQRILRKQSVPAKAGTPLDRLSPSTAIVVDAVHVYVRLLGFDQQLLDQERETEASHRRALAFLHFYYSALDRIVEEGGGLRVDFHAARLHFIVAEPAGSMHKAERVDRALAIVQALDDAAALAPSRLGISVQRSALRVGVDQGPCIAIANDDGHEMDAVFLGTPANLAAKLADGAEPGTFLSPSVRASLSLAPLTSLTELKANAAPSSIRSRLKKNSDTIAERTIDAWAKQALTRSGDVALSTFAFHRTAPPLAQVKFSELSPSRSLRMDLAALFADIDQFTDYVDRSLKAGSGRDVVRTMYVIREEQRALLKQDFGAKRLRFIGDCVVGLHAEGSPHETDASKTVEQAVRCAAALHGSMKVCQEEIPGAETLALQIGLAYGATPITRLGLRGDRSVRCAASRAVIDAERRQSAAERNETALSPSAIAVSSRLGKIAHAQRGTISADYTALDVILAGGPIRLKPSPGLDLSRQAPFRAHSGGI